MEEVNGEEGEEGEEEEWRGTGGKRKGDEEGESQREAEGKSDDWRR